MVPNVFGLGKWRLEIKEKSKSRQILQFCPPLSYFTHLVVPRTCFFNVGKRFISVLFVLWCFRMNVASLLKMGHVWVSVGKVQTWLLTRNHLGKAPWLSTTYHWSPNKQNYRSLMPMCNVKLPELALPRFMWIKQTRPCRHIWPIYYQSLQGQWFPIWG